MRRLWSRPYWKMHAENQQLLLSDTQRAYTQSSFWRSSNVPVLCQNDICNVYKMTRIIWPRMFLIIIDLYDVVNGQIWRERYIYDIELSPCVTYLISFATFYQNSASICTSYLVLSYMIKKNKYYQCVVMISNFQFWTLIEWK